MLNAVKAELYRTVHRKYPWVFGSIGLAVIAALHLYTLSYLKSAGAESIEPQYYLALPILALPLFYYLTLLVVDMVFSDEYRHHTMKNAAAQGISRWEQFWIKLWSELIVAVLLCAAVLLFYVGGAFLLLGGRPGFAEGLANLSLRLLGALPLWCAAIAIGNALAFVCRSNTGHAFAFLGVLWGVPTLVSVMSVIPPLSPLGNALSHLLMSNRLTELTLVETVTPALLAHCWVIGMAFFLLSSGLGCLAFRKRDFA